MKQLFRMLLPGGLAIAWSASGAHAQSVEPRFEVSSIKASVPGSAIHNPDCSGNRFAAGGLRFAYILRWAYDLQPSTGDEFLQRVPDSIRMKTYEIQARASSAIASESQCRAMVQSLLAERFKLAFHYETRDAELFDLVVARGGPKLQKALATDVGTDINFVLNGLPYTQAPIADAETRAHTKGVTMQELAQWLTGIWNGATRLGASVPRKKMLAINSVSSSVSRRMGNPLWNCVIPATAQSSKSFPFTP